MEPATIVQIEDLDSSHTLGEDEITVLDTLNIQKVKQTSTKKVCCFPSKKICVISCVSIWFVVFSILGVAVFLLFPRFPDIIIGSPFVPDESNGLEYTDFEGKLLTLSYPIAVNFSVKSTNYIDLFCSDISVNVFFAD